MRRSIEISQNLQDSVGAGAGAGAGGGAGVDVLMRSTEILRSDPLTRKNLREAFEGVVLRLQNKIDEQGLRDRISALENEFKYDLVRVLRDCQVMV
jgi:hypothetical protein